MALPGENTKFYETPNHPYQASGSPRSPISSAATA